MLSTIEMTKSENFDMCKNCENNDHDNCEALSEAAAELFYVCLCKHEICNKQSRDARTTDKGYTIEDIANELDVLDYIPEGKVFEKLMEKYGTCECEIELYAFIDIIRYQKNQKIIESRETQNDERLQRVEEKLDYLISMKLE
jgi:hypothetical protein